MVNTNWPGVGVRWGRGLVTALPRGPALSRRLRLSLAANHLGSLVMTRSKESGAVFRSGLRSEIELSWWCWCGRRDGPVALLWVGERLTGTSRRRDSNNVRQTDQQGPLG